MKKSATLLFILSAALHTSAQITLSQSSYASWTPKTDTLGTITSGIPAAAANAANDLSAVTYASSYSTVANTAGTNAAFSSATYFTPFSDGIPSSIGANIGWLSNSWKGVTSAGLMVYGESAVRQAFSLSAVTMNTADSVVIPQQNIVYSAPRTIVKFPATMGTTWNSSYKYTVNVNVTVTSYALNNAPFARVTNATQTDTVTGWGKMKVKRLTGTASGDMNFITVKRKVTFVDSIMMGGSPAPATILAGFGLTQGLVTNLYTINWYREGEVTPLLTANYGSSSYSPAMDGAVHLNRLAAPTGIASLSLSGEDISVYPTLLSAGSSITVDIKNAATGKWSFALVNAAGQVVAQNALYSNSSKFTVPTGSSLPAGNYYLAISKDGMPVAVNAVTIR